MNNIEEVDNEREFRKSGCCVNSLPGCVNSQVLSFYKARLNRHQDGTALTLIIKNAKALASFRQDQAFHMALNIQHADCISLGGFTGNILVNFTKVAHWMKNQPPNGELSLALFGGLS